MTNDETQNPERAPHLPAGNTTVRANFERFARGEPIAVEVGEIERELGALWQEASNAGGQAAAVSRAVLWNLVIPSRGRAALARAKALVDAVAPAVPVRAITLCLDDAATDLSATIESNVVSHPSGGRVVYSEEITLVGPPDSEAHFGAMVRALQVPGVRTATLWMDASMPSTLLKRELLPVTRRLIVDTGSCAVPLHLHELERLGGLTQRPVADLGWLRLASLRLLFAGLFDPPVGGEPLRDATRLSVRYRPGGEVSALLIVSWLGSLLDWRPLRAEQRSPGQGDSGWRFEFDRRGGQIEALLIPGPGACDESAILAIELGSGDQKHLVCREAIDRARVEVPIAPPRVVKLDAYSDAELCVTALGPRGRDPLFGRCLAYAGRLWALETTASHR